MNDHLPVWLLFQQADLSAQMKIFHALVGYLVVTALPFHPPFAFASPLETIDYDGYVNTTQHHALMPVPGIIAETCQTVNTQNDKDSALTLMKRHGGDTVVFRLIRQ
jgi:hypothetical protein